MFDIGFWELLLLAVVALVVLGPERMPAAARTLGRWVRTIKGMARQVQDELERELESQQRNDSMKKADQLGAENLSAEQRQQVDEMKRSAEELDRPYANKDKPEHHD
ncbi:Sec-independent protein translocase protein TatB [Gallaecimonas sp. GXIMD1310]|uniref:Sec-independent protein translocase protein TatB n=1 Tax=Gallaecimonas sp. GXIMD1310 TaxID=3131926 RepID=UPI003244B42C